MKVYREASTSDIEETSTCPDSPTKEANDASDVEITPFADERPDLRAPPKKNAGASRKRKADNENFVRLNIKRKRFTKKSSYAAPSKFRKRRK